MLGNESMLFSRTGRINKLFTALLATVIFFISACSTTTLAPYTEDTPPLVLLPASQAGIDDKRGRFREIFCTILEERKATLPDYLPCDDALTRVGIEPHATGKNVELGQSKHHLTAAIVPGIGWDCIHEWLNIKKNGNYTCSPIWI